jgi:DNA helicase-2/ATP-dependent DNA helicase PcrA
MLTPPGEAKHLTQNFFVDVYMRFEELRNEKSLITFNDQIYDAVLLLENNRIVTETMTNRLEHLIIDEFQDVNLSRLRLSQIIAGDTARVMVVGDDDQCIYEWQGARSSFIKRGFATEFTKFPHSLYKLTRSFRFGPMISQIAANVIGHNSDRVEKDLIAHDLKEIGFVELHSTPVAGGERQIPIVLEGLLNDGVPPKDIVVLVRKYSQSYSAQLMMLMSRIPYYVDGADLFIKGFAVQLSLNYIEIATKLNSRIDIEITKKLHDIVNRPTRYVTKIAFAKFLENCVVEKKTVYDALTDTLGLRQSGLSESAVDKLSKLASCLRRSTINDQPEKRMGAGDILSSLLGEIDFKSAFGEFQNDFKADEEVERMKMLSILFSSVNVMPENARDFLKSMDTTLGKPREDCIRVTSTFKAKGLEWDYVLMPGLTEGQIPDLRATINVCVNKSDPNRTLSPTETLESERRLFYVAVTRARKSVYLFADPTDRQFISRFIPEAAVEPTIDSVLSLQNLIRGTANANDSINKIRESTKQDARLRDGVLKMLRRLSADEQLSEDQELAFSRATFAVNTVASAPFTYPHAYTDPKKSGPASKGSSAHVGLPF